MDQSKMEYLFKPIFSSNSKLSKDGIIKFSLPALSNCPGAGDCKKYCYARKGFYQIFSQIKEAYKVNLKIKEQNILCEAAITLRVLEEVYRVKI